MKTCVGVWVDHRRAWIVTLKVPGDPYEERKTTTEEISSNVDRRVRLSGGSRTRKTPWGPQDISVDGRIEARQQQQLKEYYGRLIEKIKRADRLLIMGPGEAKHELEKEMMKNQTLSNKIAQIEPSDKMTPNEIAARVRSFFDRPDKP